MSTRNLDIAPIDQDPEFTFRFLAFNPHRQRRGLGAALVVVIIDGVDDDVQWLAEKDTQNYLEIFGPHPALLTALAYYKGEIPVVASAAAHLSQSYADRIDAPAHEAA
jgi:hypothetical protein